MRDFLRRLRDETWLGVIAALPLQLARSLGLKVPRSVYCHLPYHGIVQLDLPNGVVVQMKSRGAVLENALYWAGLSGYEAESIGVWLGFCRGSQIIIDVGAYSGLHSLLAAAVERGSIVHAFEPLPRVRTLLEENLTLNRSMKVIVHPCALSDLTGSATLHDPGSAAPSSASLEEDFLPSRDSRYSAPGALKKVDVPVRSLDSFDEFLNGQVDLIKIDAEGAEPKVLSGAREIIRRSRPVILLEYLGGSVALQKAVQELIDQRYRFFRFTADGLAESSLPSSSEGSWNVLLVPFERPMPPDLL